MAIFKRLEVPGEIDRVPELRDKVIILAYMEELQTLGAYAYLQPPGAFATPIQIRVDDVNEERREMDLTLSRALPNTLRPKDELRLYFSIEGQRFVSEVSFKQRSGFLKAVFALPVSVQHDERRQSPRARFTPRDKATVTVLEGLTDGHGVYGRLVNLSLTGACVRIDRAIAVSGQHRVNVTCDLFQPGARLEFIRILDLPYIPVVECRGRAVHLERSAIGTVMGLRFEDMDTLEAQMLAQFLTKRLPGGMGGFPYRHPKSRRQAWQEPEAAQTKEATDEAWEDPPDAPAPDTHPLPGASASATAEAQPQHVVNEKRSKRILVVMQDDLDRAILAGTLQVDGFTRTGEARNFVMAHAWLQQHKPDLVIMGYRLGMHTAQQMLERFRALGHIQGTPVVLVAEHDNVRARLMAKAARMEAVIHPPIDYDGQMRPTLHKLLNIP